MANDEEARGLAEELIDGHARLTKGRFGSRRYAVRDVDAFIAEAVARLRQGDVPEPSWVREARFHTMTDLRPAYDMRAVDALLDAFVTRLAVVGGAPDLAPGVEELIGRVERVKFRRVRIGYDCRQVDEYLEQVVDTLSQGGRPGPAPTFDAVRRGYDRLAVDAFVEELRLTA